MEDREKARFIHFPHTLNAALESVVGSLIPQIEADR